MKHLLVTVTLATLAALVGCDRGTPGGPGATSPNAEQPLFGQADETFSLIVHPVSLNQGETGVTTIGIKRGTNFSEDVSLAMGPLPKGVALDPARPRIGHGDPDTTIAFNVTDDAALGEFVVSVTGHPGKGADAVTEMKISISAKNPEPVADTNPEIVKEKWDEYVAAMQVEFDRLSENFEVLKERAATAQGDARAELDRKIEAAKPKLDEAAMRLDELKSASSDRWEKLKESVSKAFDELKKAFEYITGNEPIDHLNILRG